MTFTGVLQRLGRDFSKGLAWAVQYAIPVERLVALLFPAAGPAAKTVADATMLIQNAVIAVEQKYAAAGVQSGTGAQKLAEVVTLSGQAVNTLLAQAGVEPNSAYVSNLISAVVAILNAQSMPAAPATSAAAAPTA
ncbi:MAG: hypothetical protein KGK08_04625 [Acidobacteriota bacterium]|nr:hypothetical protein [Acidobacteriota bacterium]